MNQFYKTTRRILRRSNRTCVAVAGALVLCTVAAPAADQNLPKLDLQTAPNVSLRNEVKRAIDKGRDWLAKSQDTNGVWSTPDHPAISGLALTAFRWQPYGEAQKPEPIALKRGYAYLMSCVQPDGGIYRKDLPSYNTSLSLVALVVANRPEYRAVIVKARRFLIGLQADFDEVGKIDNEFDGGIGYGKQDKRPDLSNTSLALEALYFSKRARENN